MKTLTIIALLFSAQLLNAAELKTRSTRPVRRNPRISRPVKPLSRRISPAPIRSGAVKRVRQTGHTMIIVRPNPNINYLIRRVIPDPSVQYLIRRIHPYTQR
ncbi:MAG: hypothetical protein K9N55_16215 [Phycisphaerae bacterium]|nr:hypothetical protein [Phycisphaerae bacterium]